MGLRILWFVRRDYVCCAVYGLRGSWLCFGFIVSGLGLVEFALFGVLMVWLCDLCFGLLEGGALVVSLLFCLIVLMGLVICVSIAPWCYVR